MMLAPDNPMHKEAGDYKHVQIMYPLGTLRRRMLEGIGTRGGEGAIRVDQGVSDCKYRRERRWCVEDHCTLHIVLISLVGNVGLDGIIIALQHLHERHVDFGHGYTPRLTLLTPATTRVDVNDLRVVREQIQRMGLVFSIIGPSSKPYQFKDMVRWIPD